MRRPARLGRPTLRGLAAGPLELLRIAREMLALPVELWLAGAEAVGLVVLSAWRRALALALAARARALAALGWAEAHVRPPHGVIAVVVAAAGVLAASQLLDYRGISVAGAEYSGVEGIAAAPEVDRARAGPAHAWAGIPLALLALAITALAAAGRWRTARLLAPVGLAAVAVSLALDAPRGLDEGEAAVAYRGAEAVLLEGFWAQLAAGSVLALCGPLLAARLRPLTRGARPRAAPGHRDPAAGPAGPPVGAGGAEGASP